MPLYDEVDKVASRWKSFAIIAGMVVGAIVVLAIVWKVFF